MTLSVSIVLLAARWLQAAADLIRRGFLSGHAARIAASIDPRTCGAARIAEYHRSNTGPATGVLPDERLTALLRTAVGNWSTEAAA